MNMRPLFFLALTCFCGCTGVSIESTLKTRPSGAISGLYILLRLPTPYYEKPATLIQALKSNFGIDSDRVAIALIKSDPKGLDLSFETVDNSKFIHQVNADAILKIDIVGESTSSSWSQGQYYVNTTVYMRAKLVNLDETTLFWTSNMALSGLGDSIDETEAIQIVLALTAEIKKKGIQLSNSGEPK